MDSVGSSRDCWICYDSSRAEPLIRPCRCTGDVSAVHHDCLSRWLVEVGIQRLTRAKNMYYK
ncbi:E3 ubiquitin-protein ligase MARCH [Pseudomonas aeruginosa]|nr:E3 ubiquitin-protein ligase MARCH [Pseudomonas aeruginosa]